MPWQLLSEGVRHQDDVNQHIHFLWDLGQSKHPDIFVRPSCFGIKSIHNSLGYSYMSIRASNIIQQYPTVIQIDHIHLSNLSKCSWFHGPQDELGRLWCQIHLVFICVLNISLAAWVLLRWCSFKQFKSLLRLILLDPPGLVHWMVGESRAGQLSPLKILKILKHESHWITMLLRWEWSWRSFWIFGTFSMQSLRLGQQWHRVLETSTGLISNNLIHMEMEHLWASMSIFQFKILLQWLQIDLEKKDASWCKLYCLELMPQWTDWYRLSLVLVQVLQATKMAVVDFCNFPSWDDKSHWNILKHGLEGSLIHVIYHVSSCIMIVVYHCIIVPLRLRGSDMFWFWDTKMAWTVRKRGHSLADWHSFARPGQRRKLADWTWGMAPLFDGDVDWETCDSLMDFRDFEPR